MLCNNDIDTRSNEGALELGCELIGDICYSPGDGLALLDVFRLKRQKPMLLRQCIRVV